MHKLSKASCVLFLAWAVEAALGQPVTVAPPADFGADDAKRIAELTASGERREGKIVILVTPAGARSDTDEGAILDRLEKGVAALHVLVGRHPWQQLAVEKITYYMSADDFVSHASGRGAVFISLARWREGRAPFFHEAAHELLQSMPPGERLSAPGPMWLHEGLAEFVALTAAARAGVPEGDVFQSGV